MTTEEILDKHGEFLDKAALNIMKSYVDSQKPTDINDSVQLARIAYRGALALLEVKLNDLSKIIEKDKYFYRIRKESINKKS